MVRHVIGAIATLGILAALSQPANALGCHAHYDVCLTKRGGTPERCGIALRGCLRTCIFAVPGGNTYRARGGKCK